MEAHLAPAGLVRLSRRELVLVPPATQLRRALAQDHAVALSLLLLPRRLCVLVAPPERAGRDELPVAAGDVDHLVCGGRGVGGATLGQRHDQEEEDGAQDGASHGRCTCCCCRRRRRRRSMAPRSQAGRENLLHDESRMT